MAGIVLSLGLAGSGAAQRYNPGENLIVDIPPGFVLAHREGDARMAMEEFTPLEETLQTWQELITLQVFFDLGGRAPDGFLHTMLDGFAAACPTGRAGEITPVEAAPYSAALVIASCPDSSRTEGVESFAAYAMGGVERLYVLRYAWARVPSAEDFEAARAFFAGARICDTTRADAPCPER